jgi:hypothetical protein
MSSSPIFGSERTDEPLAQPRYSIATTIPIPRPASRQASEAGGGPPSDGVASAHRAQEAENLREFARPAPASTAANGPTGGQEPTGGDAPGIWNETTTILPALAGALASASPAATPTVGVLETPAETGSEMATLRAILLGADTHDDTRVADERMAAVERRLDTLAAELGELRTATRGNDATAEFMTAVRREIAALRAQQLDMMEHIRERERVADERCRLRQRRIRTAEHVELRRLRRARSAPGATTMPSLAAMPSAEITPRAASPATPSSAAAPAATESAMARFDTGGPVVWPGDWLESDDPRARVMRADHAPSLERDVAKVRDVAPVRWPLAVRIEDVEAPEDAESRPLGDPGLGEIWRTIVHASSMLLRAIFALVVVLGHLALEDMRAAGERVGEMLRRDPREPVE